MKRTGSPNSEERMVKIGHRIKTDSGRVEFVARIGGRKPLACSSFEYEDIEEVTKDEAEDSLWADQESQMEEEEDEEVESEHEDGEDDDDEDVEVNGAAGW